MPRRSNRFPNCSHARNCDNCRGFIASKNGKLQSLGCIAQITRLELVHCQEYIRQLEEELNRNSFIDIPIQPEDPRQTITDIKNQLLAMPVRNDDQIDTNCTSCYEPFDKALHTPVVPSCGHIICITCMDKWMSVNSRELRCAYCRSLISHVTRVYA